MEMHNVEGHDAIILPNNDSYFCIKKESEEKDQMKT